MRICIAVDLDTPGHEWIVDRGGRFAARTRGSADLLFVCSELPEAQRARLDALRERLPEEAQGELRFHAGAVADVLVAVSEDYDAIVVGPREPGALEAMLRGTIATRVIRDAKCAVLVPRHKHGGEPPQPRLLLGVDLAADNRKLVGEAIRWTQRLGGILDVGWVDAALPWVDDPDERARLRQGVLDARRGDLLRLEALMEDLGTAHRGEPRLGEGTPEEALAEMSEAYDYVVVGTLGRKGLAGLIRGSVAGNVVRTARCDVLTLPSHLLHPS